MLPCDWVHVPLIKLDRFSWTLFSMFRFSFLMGLGFTLKPFFEFFCGKDGVIPVKDVFKHKCCVGGAV